MNRRFISIALTILFVPGLGALAYAASHSVADTPAPQRIFPASSEHTTPADDPANLAPSNIRADDNSGTGRASSASGSSAGVTGDHTVSHVVGDDHRATPTIVAATTATTAPRTIATTSRPNSNSGPGSGSSSTTAPTTATTVDDSGHGQGGHGADDPVGHT
jgi:hypothetical protein